MKTINNAIKRRIQAYRCRRKAAKQGRSIEADPGELIVTTFYDVEGDYAIHGKHSACFEALHIIADIEDKVGIRSTYNVVAKLAAEAPDLFRSLEKAGHEIASHSLDHRILTSLPTTERRDSIFRAKDILDTLGLDVIGHRSPQSRWNFRVIADLQAAGYQWNAENDAHNNPYVITEHNKSPPLWRLPIAMDDWWYEGAAMGPDEVLTRWQEGVITALSHGGYLAIGFHPWVEHPGDRLAAFSEFMQWLADHPNIQVMPFKKVIALANIG